jgi:predicted signal transduction protein with EAL and GGDEF domain
VARSGSIPSHERPKNLGSGGAPLPRSAAQGGIETPAQLAALLDLGCQYGQGFLLGRPVPAAELGTVLRTIDVDAPEAGSSLSQPR